MDSSEAQQITVVYPSGSHTFTRTREGEDEWALALTTTDPELGPGPRVIGYDGENVLRVLTNFLVPENLTCLAMVMAEEVPEPLDPPRPTTPSSLLHMRFEVRADADATPEDIASQAASAFEQWRAARPWPGAEVKR